MAEPRATLCALPLPPPRGLRKPDHRDFFLGCECVCASCVCLARRGYAHGMFCGDAVMHCMRPSRVPGDGHPGCASWWWLPPI
jgi:hypothetical protein